MVRFKTQRESFTEQSQVRSVHQTPSTACSSTNSCAWLCLNLDIYQQHVIYSQNYAVNILNTYPLVLESCNIFTFILISALLAQKLYLQCQTQTTSCSFLSHWLWDFVLSLCFGTASKIQYRETNRALLQFVPILSTGNS